MADIIFDHRGGVDMPHPSPLVGRPAHRPPTSRTQRRVQAGRGRTPNNQARRTRARGAEQAADTSPGTDPWGTGRGNDRRRRPAQTHSRGQTCKHCRDIVHGGGRDDQPARGPEAAKDLALIFNEPAVATGQGQPTERQRRNDE